MALTKRKTILIIMVLLSLFTLYPNLYQVTLLQTNTEDIATNLFNMTLRNLQLNFNKSGVHLRIFGKKRSVNLEAFIGENLKNPLHAVINDHGKNTVEILFTPKLSLRIYYFELKSLTNKLGCYNIFWNSKFPDSSEYSPFQDRIQIRDSYWYGGALMSQSYWPMNDRKHALAPFVTGNSYHDDYGSIQERFWLSSSGSSIFVEYDVPLFVDINQLNPGWLTLMADNKKPYKFLNKLVLQLNYTLCAWDKATPRTTFLLAAGKFWKKPKGIPNENLFKYPTWSTWAAFKRSISSDVIMSFANNISSNGFRCSQLIIDDGWMTNYGDFEFNSKLFPDPKRLIGKLKNILDTTVSLWVHPFSSCFSSAFWKRDSYGRSYWVRSFVDWMPSQIMWWNGIGTILDLTNLEAYTWYVSELQAIQKLYGIDSFKFDAGESTWIPSNGKMEIDFSNPSDYTKLFSKVVLKSDFNGERLQEVRSAVSSQHMPFFVRLIDKNSDWSENNGILSIIPQTLTTGVIGYPFVFPDMIGGNGYFGIFIHFTVLPDRELYIRWLQLSALMPTMQFSIPPWSYDAEVIEIARNMSELHTNFSDLIIRLAEEAKETGAPIIRPLWWTWNGANSPNPDLEASDKDLRELFTCETEFMLGNDVVVAPVLKKGDRKRMVYLPSGFWRRGGYNNSYEGDKWHVVNVTLKELAYFRRIDQ